MILNTLSQLRFAQSLLEHVPAEGDVAELLVSLFACDDCGWSFRRAC